MHDLFFLNFFGVSILIGTLFYILVSAVIFFQVPDKSQATRFLGIAYFCSGLLAFAFFPPHSFYHPLLAWHRWLTVPSALLTHIFFAQVFYYFPEPKFTRAGRIIMVIQLLAAACITGVFYYATLGRSYEYSFAAQLWDFDSDDVSRLVAAGIAFNISHALIAGIVHTIARKGHRALMGALLAALTTALLFPTITNVMSRDGLLERDVHQTVLVLMSIIGLFSFLIIYLNNTRDRTTFMVKLVGISLVTFMVILVMVSSFAFADKESAYDSLHAERTSRLAVQQDYPVEDLRYVLSYSAKSGKVSMGRNADAAQFDTSVLSRELASTALYEEIRAAGSQNWKLDALAVLDRAPEHAATTAAFLSALVKESANAQTALAKCDELQKQIAYRRAKLREIPEKKLRAQLPEFAAKLPPSLAPFAEELKGLAQLPGSDSELKARSLLVFTPIRPQGHRNFRSASGHNYTAFTHYDARTETVTEAGYSYVEYRRVIHGTGLRLFAVFVGGTLLIAVGFQFFFLGILVRPLEALLSGVRKVNGGSLDVSVTPRMSDEIGFLTVSFNSMVASIKSAREKLQQYADELEEKVKERTAELSETLRVVQDLKQQQDGDYFLTSLLIKPLSRNLARSQQMEVEFLIEQKKKFEFRKWKEEIGGDFCSAHSIRLQEKDYTVFVNADAMGKSMQGAGGALVLGAVFESLMDRTHNMQSLQSQSPERWIKNAFQELQTVFESFDGSMLVSMVLGLIDDTTGLMYYVNVEHPWTVLYRNGTAAFIEQGHTFRKLGVTGLSGQLQVHTFQLEPGDVIVAGSDGRDDLQLGTDAAGDRIINEDEQLFVRLVQGSQARLSAIRSGLEEVGALTDDLSLIRIAYRAEHAERTGDRIDAIAALHARARDLAQKHEYSEAAHALEEALAIDPRSLKTIRLLVKILLEQKNYETAFAHMEDYVYLKPMDTDMIYLASYLCKKLKRYKQAVEFGERVRLRSPNMVRNLTNLAEVYVRLGNKPRALKIVQEALKTEPENQRARRIEALIHE